MKLEIHLQVLLAIEYWKKYTPVKEDYKFTQHINLNGPFHGQFVRIGSLSYIEGFTMELRK